KQNSAIIAADVRRFGHVIRTGVFGIHSIGLTMRLTIIGSGDAFGSGGRFNTCLFLETAKGKLLVDCGASSLVALKAQGLDPNEVDGIVLSHLHGDHLGALPFLLPDLRARRIMLTHMNPVMLVHLDEVRAAGALVAEDGAVIDL